MPATGVADLGQMAPDFRLRGPGGAQFTLSEHLGRKHVVLVFYPLAFSPVCSHQLPDVQKFVERARGLDGEILGISVDSHWANEAFARQLQLTFPLLSDFRREASQAFGVLDPVRLHSSRVTFVVDKGGRIAYRDAALPDEMPSMDRVIEALEGLNRGQDSPQAP